MTNRNSLIRRSGRLLFAGAIRPLSAAVLTVSLLALVGVPLALTITFALAVGLAADRPIRQRFIAALFSWPVITNIAFVLVVGPVGVLLSHLVPPDSIFLPLTIAATVLLPAIPIILTAIAYGWSDYGGTNLVGTGKELYQAERDYRPSRRAVSYTIVETVYEQGRQRQLSIAQRTKRLGFLPYWQDVPRHALDNMGFPAEDVEKYRQGAVFSREQVGDDDRYLEMQSILSMWVQMLNEKAQVTPKRSLRSTHPWQKELPNW